MVTDDRTTAAESFRFQKGQLVIERFGTGDFATIEHSIIDFIDRDVCRTSSGRFYDRLTGRGMPPSDNYRAIHSISFSEAPKA